MSLLGKIEKIISSISNIVDNSIGICKLAQSGPTNLLNQTIAFEIVG